MDVTGIKRNSRMLLNTTRRGLVNFLLGNELILQKIKTPSGYKVELVDEKRRLNYGRWDIQKIDQRDFRLSR